MSEIAEKKADTVTIEIDGVALDAAKGAMIIEVADRAGITIPRFCYHQKLSIAANCRMCLVDVEKAPKPLPACATPVMDGMKVYTQSKRALSAQQNVMEFLLINHPLDCPICDQGGECELQDLSMGFGRSVSRFTERKRSVKDENLGSLISTDMTRCIHCTRCVRFLEEISGTRELGGIGRGETMKISTFIGRSIDSELSGNIIDLCPVGALTNKPFRYTARPWELRSRESVAPHDSVGSNLHYHMKRGRLMRSVPRNNEAVNETWLSDRDRWGYMGLNSDQRATEPLIRDADDEWQAVPWDVALDRAAELLQQHQADELGVLVSPRATNEELYLAQKLGRDLGCPNIDHRLRQVDCSDQDTAPLAPGMAMSIRDLSGADGIVLIGSNIRHEQPILGHKVRQAWLRGAGIAAINPVDYDFHFDLSAGVVGTPREMLGVLAAAVAAAGGKLPRGVRKLAADGVEKTVAEVLGKAQRGAVIFGHAAAVHPRAGLLRLLARRLADATGAAFCEPPASANSAGAWKLGAVPHRGPGGQAVDTPGMTIREMVESPRRGYLVYDFEPLADTVYGNRILEALQSAQTVYCGAFVTDEIRSFADVILPLAVAPEVDGSLTNADGRSQAFQAGGTPPGDARAGWKVLRMLGNALALQGFEYTRIDQIRAEYEEILASVEPAPASDFDPASQAEGDGLEVIADLPLYAVDGLVRRSRPLQETAHGLEPHVSISPEDAERLGIASGDRKVVEIGAERSQLAVTVDARVASGAVRVPLGVVPLDGTATFASIGGN